MKFHGIGDSSPPNTLLKQEGLQLAEASFRDESLRFPGLSNQKQSKKGFNQQELGFHQRNEIICD